MKSAQEWGGMYQRYKNINLSKNIQKSNERVSQDKESLERHNGKYKTMMSLPKYGSYLHPNMVKNANFRGLHRI